MAFRFTLDSVLRVRESVEEKEEQVLQKAQFEVERVRQRIDELTEELAQANRERNEALLHATEAYRLQDLQAGIEAAKEARQTLLETLETVKAERDRQMKIYQAARSGRQMLSDLETQQRGEWEVEQTRMQQKRIDDIFAARFQRG